MADLPPLPAVGAKPWTLNPHIQALNAESTATAAAVNGRLSPQGIIDSILGLLDPVVIDVTPGRYPGLNTSGTADVKNIVNSIVQNATTGATLRFHGSLRFDSFLTVPGSKFLTLDWRDANPIRNHTGFMIRATGSYDSPINVTAVNTASATYFGQSYVFSRLTLNFAPSWKRGDLVRVYADDYAPTARYKTTDSTAPRIAEYASVLAVNGTTVDLTSTLIDNYTTNVKIIRVQPGSVTSLGGNWDVTDDVMSAQVGNSGALRTTGLIRPRVVDQTVLREVGPSLSMRSNYGYSVERQTVRYGVNNPDAGVVGYGVMDQGSMFGRTYDSMIVDSRHGWTDVAAGTAADGTDPMLYGRTMFAEIYGADVYATGQTGLDTHHGSIGITYVAPVVHLAPGSKNAFLWRGQYHRAISPTIYGGENVARVYNDTTGSNGDNTAPESYGHYMTDVRSFNTVNLLDIDVRGAGHAQAGVRQPQTNIVIDGSYSEGLQSIYRSVNGNAVIRSSVPLELASNLRGAAMEAINSKVDTQFDINGNNVTSAVASSSTATPQSAAPRVLYSSLSDIRHSGRLSSSTALRASVGTEPFYCETTTTRAHFNITFEQFWSDNPFRVQEAILANSVIWNVDPAEGDNSNTQRSSISLQIDNANLSTTAFPARLMRSPENTLTLIARITDSTPRDLGALARGKKIGQQLTIFGGSMNAALTLKNGASFRLTLMGGTDKTMTAGQSILLMWTGTTWTQVRAVA